MILAECYDAFLIDLDGVVWRGDTPIPKADRTIATLREQDKRIVFITNNSSKTPRDYAVKLMRMNIPTGPEDIVTSGHAVTAKLERLELKPGARVHVLGGEGLARVLASERFVPTTDATDVEAVVIGWKRDLTFEDIRRAADLARDGLPLIASNSDATYPADEGRVLPGTGAILAAVETASGRKATVVGKPRPELFELALERADVDAHRALVVGDRPETDLVGARAAGIPCALVLSGVTDERSLSRLVPVPEDILDDLSDLVTDLPRPTIEHREGSVAAIDGEVVAEVMTSRRGKRLVVDDVRVSRVYESDHAWRIIRRLLVEAADGASRVIAGDAIKPYLDRVGIQVEADQPELFTS